MYRSSQEYIDSAYSFASILSVILVAIIYFLTSNFNIPLDFPKNAQGEVIQTKNLDNNLEVEVVEKMAPPKEYVSLGDGEYEPIQAGGINASEL